MSSGRMLARSEKVRIGFTGCLCIFFFLISPIFSNLSAFGKISIGDILVISSLMICLCCTRTISSICALGIISLLLACLFAAIQYASYYPEGLQALVRMSFYIFSFFVFLNLFNRAAYSGKIKRIYLLISVLCSALLIFQVFIYHAFDTVIVYINTPFDIQPSSVIGLDIKSQGFRSGGLFKEPSYFAIFVAPAMIYAASLRKWILWLILSFAVVLSTSTLGFAFVILSVARLTNTKYLVILSPLIAIFLALTLTNIIPILPERVSQTMSGEGSFSMRVIEPFTRVFLNGNVLSPNYSVLKDLANPDAASSIWFNSLSYSVVVLGILGILPIGFIFAYAGRNQFVFIGVMLAAVNGLTNPFFLVSVVTMKILDDIAIMSPEEIN